MPKINREEYEILKGLDDKWKWITRDKDGVLGVYDEKVVKTKFHNFWIMAIKKKIDSTLFSFIQWEDEEPYSIQELIDEYLDDEYGYFNMKLSREFEEFIKKESEETEVKNIEWLKKELNTIKEEAQEILDEYDNRGPIVYRFEERLHSVNVFRNLLDQLDEPEVLSQELPVIPKFVADWIEEVKKQNKSMVFAIWHIYDKNEIGESPNKEENRLFQWMELADNDEVFARAWLDGFTVAEEPLYRARLKVITDEFIASYLRTQSSDAEDRLKALEIGSKYIHEDYRHLSEFTKDELKRLDIWDSEQWEVEELEQ